MSLFQYVGEGHTLVRTLKSSAEKVKVVQGEAVEIEDGLYSQGRLIMAGFQKILDGVEDIITGTAEVIEDVTNGSENISDILNDKAPEDTTPPENTEDATTSTPEAPSVQVTATDDGKDAITLEVTTTKPDRKAIMEELTALGVEFKPVGESTTSLVEKLAAAKAK